jgi:anti-sigma regulatory factor (Ser/Thr protein kinase)
MRPFSELRVLIESRLPPSSTAPALARAYVRGLAARFPPRVIEDALLVVNELVTNAVTHGPGGRPILLRVLGVARLRIEVGDAGRWDPPDVRMPDPDHGSTTGWGLPIVDALADGWGVTTSPGRTVAWAEIDVA